MSEKRKKSTTTERVARIAVFPFFHLFWRPELVNEGKFLPFEGPCFVYGNHANNYDPFIMNMFTPWGAATTGVLTQEYFRGKWSGKAMRQISLIPTRKHVPEPHLIRKIYKKLENKEAIVIYPEGGRRWDGRPLSWIESTAKIFIKCGVPVYPVTTEGSYVSWPRWAKYPRPAKLKVTGHAPLQFERKAPFDEALSALRKPMDFDETIVPEDIKPKWAYRPADGIHRLLYCDPYTGENHAFRTPDGTHVVNHAGTKRFKMLPDSLLLDLETTEIVNPSDLYAQIKSLPLPKNKNGSLIESEVILHIEHTFPELEPRGNAVATLYDDAVHIKGDGIDWTISLHDFIHMGVERSYKLQLFQKDRMLQLSFPFKGGSALQWQDTFLRLKNQHEQSTASEFS